MAIVVPLALRISGVTSSQVVTAVPLIETIRSFSCSPATDAGDFGSPGLHSGWGTCTLGAVNGTQVATFATIGVTVAMP